ncbi:DUF2059 domain-containing protein [Thalassomonas sp. M1454]|uniref:DUF2059 domain-containing protein n=1 Tax=Thalassomonas sp. M1454 TaxID=2594477 RepID=UPI00117D911B|nr:DUF2059 domain-containing protein [Thalassomonas sp. M1454]TRX55158.1 DUF2059 domain-containing protein [Thalassomonas sp. M1454]
MNKWIFLLTFLSSATFAQTNASYEEAFYSFTKSVTYLFQPSDKLINQLQELMIDEKYKEQLIQCVQNDNGNLLKEYIPFFQKHLTIDDLVKLTDWFKSQQGQQWLAIQNGKVDPKSLPEETIETINDFVNSKIMKHFNSAVIESKSVAKLAGQKHAEYCFSKL